MTRTLSQVTIGIAFCICALTSAAHAQATRTWVSGVGDDANPCSRTAPCKTFAGAISKTAAGGEIDALDPGGFGAVTITKAMTIDGGGGVVASTLVNGVPAFIVNAGATDRVILRNLRITGASSTNLGTTGIRFIAGLALDVQNCFIERFANYGIDFQPAVRGFMTVQDTTISSTGQGGILSASAASTGGANRVSIINSRIVNSAAFGIKSGQNSRVQVSSTLVSSNGGSPPVDYGVVADGATATVNIESSTITNNPGGGIHATNNGIVRISNTMISVNNNGGIIADAGGQVLSFGNNRIAGNIPSDNPPSSSVPQQ